MGIVKFTIKKAINVIDLSFCSKKSYEAKMSVTEKNYNSNNP
jgi:hypothetical protein